MKGSGQQLATVGTQVQLPLVPSGQTVLSCETDAFKCVWATHVSWSHDLLPRTDLRYALSICQTGRGSSFEGTSPVYRQSWWLWMIGFG